MSGVPADAGGITAIFSELSAALLLPNAKLGEADQAPKGFSRVGLEAAKGYLSCC